MEKTDQSSTSPPDRNADHVHAIGEEAGALLGEARQKGSEQLEHYRDSAADQLDSLQEGARSAAAALEGNDSLGLSRYLTQAAECMGDFAEQVRHESAESLLQRGAQLARSNPALFLAGSVAVGFAISRFMRASDSHAGTPSVAEHGFTEPRPAQPVMPDRGSDVSTREPYTPVDPIGPGAGTPVSGSPFERDPLKGGE
ncbi:hypothetical protein QSV36_09230 [Pseudomonas sp. BCRC 81390]|uniref:hypothetical protein n=1 Tax=Pseudomonas sp. BCRC 81390 TaxID=3054778 RepID=UPI002597E97A|nr:hypothetical protein [Pseudomonas sp. BCRC 81390]MDM3885775.1 hypothetical protein [Pseudomonas sp. BCRC 81390]